MPLFFITGISTAGKSAVALELNKRGYESYDTEHNDVSAWYNKKTGEHSADFNNMPERTPEWLSQNEWLISLAWIRELAGRSKGKPVFICGGSANESEIRVECDKVFFLKTKIKTIRQRVNNARDHDYGKKPHELSMIIKGNKRKEAEYKKIGVEFVDATQSLAKVVDEIIEKSGAGNA